MACNSICKGLFCFPFSVPTFPLWICSVAFIRLGVVFSCVGKVPWLLDVGRLLLGIRNGIAGYLGKITAGVQANSELDKIQVTVGREEFETALRSLRGKKANVFEEAASIKVAFQLHMHNFYCNWAEGLSKYVGLSKLAAVKVSSAGLCVGSFLTGMSFLLQVYMGERIMFQIFPINIKGAVGSLAGLTGNICSWTVSYNFNFLFQWSSTGTFFIFSAICGVCVIFIAKMIPETKGRTLEEIQASLTTSP
ncbi:sugar transporter ERD6-like 5 isoform X2 [Gossypium australe]|uniref:Sugar transporter ERD6-like 5 isoform X2 n=1 Tax=Gossypium australe TaxID=47621 RepID=A0A5B6VU64_9ROSI|nr:sugar transporter ERD6-like 5 isoform X2 [Gossypium australe]